MLNKLVSRRGWLEVTRTSLMKHYICEHVVSWVKPLPSSEAQV